MSDATTIARPYAKAIFKHALEAKCLSEWSATLHALAQAVLQPDTTNFICNPATTPELQTQLLLAIFSKKSNSSEMMKTLENVVGLLAENKRLLVLPDICVQYDVLRAEQEKTLTANVASFVALSDAQQQELIDSLSQRLQRKVTLEMSIDKSLLGGAIIRAGDLVIDGSVRGKLNKLGTSLAA